MPFLSSPASVRPAAPLVASAAPSSSLVRSMHSITISACDELALVCCLLLMSDVLLCFPYSQAPPSSRLWAVPLEPCCTSRTHAPPCIRRQQAAGSPSLEST